ncbi:UDP-N-acetylglucosamine 1-carboxyvinyltransferase [subsurface metagenome]
MAATLLTKDVCILRNIPRLTDVDIMADVIRKLGVKVEWKEDNNLYIDSDNFNNYEAPYELVKMMRASILVMGPLLARLKRAKISLPGGCAIGARSVNSSLLTTFVSVTSSFILGGSGEIGLAFGLTSN